MKPGISTSVKHSVSLSFKIVSVYTKNTSVSYLSQKSEMLDDEVSALGFACSTFSTDDYTLREKKKDTSSCLSKLQIKLVQLTKDLSMYI